MTATYPLWVNWKTRRENTGPLAEGKGQRPDYSFDNWLKLTKHLDDEMSSLVGQAKEKDKELDTKAKKAKSEPKPPKPEEDKDEENKEKQAAWKQLRNIAKERDEKSGKKGSASSGKSSK